MTDMERLHPRHAELRKSVRQLQAFVAILLVAFLASTSWLALRSPSIPSVISVERLDIVEPDGSPVFVLANSQRPAAATMNGQVLLQGQEEERKGVPSFIFFDGKGDEVGGFILGERTTPEGYSATRHLSLDGYQQDQTVVLAHYQSPQGASAGLRISDRPLDLSLLEAFADLGLAPSPTRQEMEAAIQTIPEAERAEKLRALFGVSRLFVGSDTERNASLVMRDGTGRPRIIISVPEEGEPSIQILGEDGETVFALPPR